MADKSVNNSQKQIKPYLYKKGQSGNPAGRPIGSISDKTVAINIIFKILEENKDDFVSKMRVLAKQNIVAYYMKFVAPFQPKDFNITSITTIEVSDEDRQQLKGIANTIAKAQADIK